MLCATCKSRNPEQSTTCSVCGSELGDSKSPKQMGVEDTTAPKETTGVFEASDLPRDWTDKPSAEESSARVVRPPVPQLHEEAPESGLDLTRVVPYPSLLGNTRKTK